MMVNQIANNQIIIEDGNKSEFWSYGTKIAEVKYANTYITDNDDYLTRTTSKYLYKYLQGYSRLMVQNKKQLEKLIKEGFITRKELK